MKNKAINKIFIAELDLDPTKDLETEEVNAAYKIEKEKIK